jgi:3-oxo-5-alpha-steroid 4-dehydrogenase 1
LSEHILFNRLIVGWIALAVIVFISLFFFAAPYGRYSRSGWGPEVGTKKGWVIMESAAPVVFALCFLLGTNPITATSLILLFTWEAHYIHRAFIYPFGLRGQGNRMPIVVMGIAFIFNAVNAYLNGRYIFTFSDGYTNEWLVDPRFIIGMGFFVAGFIINRRADRTLRALRKPGESDYKIANGGMYRWISCPNYLGEITIWIGWAVATWSIPGLAFAIWTIANLVPRARTHHKWYREYFPDYPSERKALVPGLW